MSAMVVNVTSVGRRTPRETGVTEMTRISSSRQRSRRLIPSSVKNLESENAEGTLPRPPPLFFAHAHSPNTLLAPGVRGDWHCVGLLVPLHQIRAGFSDALRRSLCALCSRCAHAAH